MLSVCTIPDDENTTLALQKENIFSDNLKFYSNGDYPAVLGRYKTNQPMPINHATILLPSWTVL